MRYSGDKQQHCGRCRKRTKFKRCPKCGGKGGSPTTQCRHCGSTGYKCENGMNDAGHS